MFFARVRWIGRVLDNAAIDTNSKVGKELTSTLIEFSKYCEEKNRRGDGALRVRLDVGAAGWALLGAIFAPEETRVASHLSLALGLSEADASEMLTKIRQAAIAVAKRDMPELYSIIGDWSAQADKL